MKPTRERMAKQAAQQLREDGERIEAELEEAREEVIALHIELDDAYKAKGKLKAELEEARGIAKEAWDVLGLFIQAHHPMFIQRAKECMEKCNALRQSLSQTQEFVPAGTYPIKGGGVHQATRPCPKCKPQDKGDG